MGVWDWKQIEKLAAAALAKKADDMNASRRLGQAIGMQGNPAAAIAHLQKHTYQFPKDAKAYDLMAGMQILAGAAQDALASADKALATDANFKAARYNRAVACVKLGKREEGIRDLATAIAANADYREAAAEDADFAELAQNSRFKEAIAPPKKEEKK
ncbi:MAG: hypothetical protein HUU15_13030 [Candidatus Brocadiae bacterium]|nr:hypothetical protein [Candidatus Brocadiia bacterium]